MVLRAVAKNLNLELRLMEIRQISGCMGGRGKIKEYASFLVHINKGL